MNIRDRLEINPYTVKLVASPESRRAQLFKDLGKRTQKVNIRDTIDSTVDPHSDFNIFCDFGGYSDPTQFLKALVEAPSSTISIFDVWENLFDDEVANATVTVAAMMANFVTCVTPELQERIYEETGRLAPIINFPLMEEHFSPPHVKENPTRESLKILWFGYMDEVFTARQVKNQNKDLNITLAVPFKKLPDCKYLKNFEDAKYEVIEEADLVYLPKTYSVEDEEHRLAKVEDCVMLGTFVCAPELENDFLGLAYDGQLDDAVAAYLQHVDVESFVKQSQHTLLTNYSVEGSVNQLLFALKEAPNDSYTQELDSFLEFEQGT